MYRPSSPSKVTSTAYPALSRRLRATFSANRRSSSTIRTRIRPYPKRNFRHVKLNASLSIQRVLKVRLKLLTWLDSVVYLEQQSSQPAAAHVRLTSYGSPG